jgi:IS605 OrfB family transposase
LHAKIGRQRLQYQRIWAHRLTRDFDMIGIEDLNIAGLIKKASEEKQAKPGNIYDAAWGKLREQLEWKARLRNRRIIAVDPKNTSRTCLHCSSINAGLTLKDRVWLCPICGKENQRDTTAAKNILKRAVAQAENEGNSTENGALGVPSGRSSVVMDGQRTEKVRTEWTADSLPSASVGVNQPSPVDARGLKNKLPKDLGRARHKIDSLSEEKDRALASTDLS